MAEVADLRQRGFGARPTGICIFKRLCHAATPLLFGIKITDKTGEPIRKIFAYI